jgi:hypothetical protein
MFGIDNSGTLARLSAILMTAANDLKQYDPLAKHAAQFSATASDLELPPLVP